MCWGLWRPSPHHLVLSSTRQGLGAGGLWVQVTSGNLGHFLPHSAKPQPSHLNSGENDGPQFRGMITIFILERRNLHTKMGEALV